jgi:hypothetical protein
MVQVLSEQKYVCEICHRIYPTVGEAKDCQFGHDIIYVPFQREDLKRLVAFINIGEPQLLTKSLLATINKYGNIQSEPDPDRNRNRPQF